jgi:glyoxylase-like metal-dependent hydrolase (beta-lactamase superfamily II)
MEKLMRWRVGDVRITRVVDMADFPIEPQFLFNIETDKVLEEEWMRPDFVTPEGGLLVSVHAFVVEADGKRILVDTCLGNDKSRHTPAWNMRQGNFLQDLANAGFPPETIDIVVCTHLHVDHVGWNTRLEEGRWVPTFPNARYLFGRIEWDHWRHELEEEERLAATGGDHAAQLLQIGVVMGDSVLPIIEAGLHELVEVDHRITPEIRLEPTPGHTPGHVSLHILSQGEEAIITGDMLHHPIQCVFPELGAHVDWDSAVSGATRRTFFGRHADRPVLILGTHFPTPTAGWLRTHGDHWRVQLARPAAE